ncbi:GNAT family N-acetyltransferase [Corynebacterium sp.]|uniref:GNAT family N-acetyltransferase n=1 Tax=Corynebacterium sp. TaxID=1720 RepID=UPI0026DD8AC8|nr:GNAT family N-acetyltransferase [Corynebacterium sp.]MDO5033023.1 GNAT family N-acetyltransferase [Corynebacterium sp.]
MIIRDATHADVPAMTDTLNWAIRNTDVIFRAHEATVDERKAHLEQLHNDGCPCLIAEDDQGTYLGWALYRPFGDPAVWLGSYETTIYLDPAAQGKGVGTQLLGAVVQRARADEKVHTLLARIVATNAASIKLHEKFGFATVGTFREVSRKFDHWLDLTHLQLIV